MTSSGATLESGYTSCLTPWDCEASKRLKVESGTPKGQIEPRAHPLFGSCCEVLRWSVDPRALDSPRSFGWT